MMGYGDGMFYGGGFMWVFWIVLVVIVVMLLKQFSGTSEQPKEHDALEILKRRYAKGEIDEAEYQKRKETLEE
jgi:putative membrane protein